MIQYCAMQYHNWNAVEEEPLNPLIGRKMIHGQTMTVARIRLRKGAVVPMHSHPNEQISMLESGALRFTISGEERVLRAVQVVVDEQFTKVEATEPKSTVVAVVENPVPVSVVMTLPAASLASR